MLRDSLLCDDIFAILESQARLFVRSAKSRRHAAQGNQAKKYRWPIMLYIPVSAPTCHSCRCQSCQRSDPWILDAWILDQSATPPPTEYHSSQKNPSSPLLLSNVHMVEIIWAKMSTECIIHTFKCLGELKSKFTHVHVLFLLGGVHMNFDTSTVVTSKLGRGYYPHPAGSHQRMWRQRASVNNRTDQRTRARKHETKQCAHANVIRLQSSGLPWFCNRVFPSLGCGEMEMRDVERGVALTL
jgi:hypothetical protein